MKMMIRLLNRAAIAALPLSSKAFSLNPIVKVSTGLADNFDMTPTIILESMPPLRKAPRGTSLIIILSTAWNNRSRSIFFTGIIIGYDRSVLYFNVPIPFRLNNSLRTVCQIIPGIQLAYAFYDCMRCRNIGKG